MITLKAEINNGSLTVRNLVINIDGTLTPVPASMATDRDGWWKTDGQFYWIV